MNVYHQIHCPSVDEFYNSRPHASIYIIAVVSGKTNLISIFINIPHYGPALLNCTWSGQTIIDVPTTLYITYYTMLITKPGRVLWRSWENIKTCIQVDSFVDGSRKSSSKYEYCDLHWVETTGQDMVRKIWIERYSEL